MNAAIATSLAYLLLTVYSPFSALAWQSNGSVHPSHTDSLPQQIPVSAEEMISRQHDGGKVFTNAFVHASPAVVSILLLDSSNDEPRMVGSGFFVHPDGLLVTNAHFLSNHSGHLFIVHHGEMKQKVMLHGIDERHNIALLQVVNPKPVPVIPLAEQNSTAGDWSLALGISGDGDGFGEATASIGVIKESELLISTPVYEDTLHGVIKTDAGIDRHNSGGPLLNIQGEVIGMNTYLPSHAGDKAPIRFAMPAFRIRELLNHVALRSAANLAYDPGFEFQEISEFDAAKMGGRAKNGLVVTEVNRDGPAFECGVMPGDIVVKIEGEVVTSESHAYEILGELTEGETLSLELLRDQKRYRTQMKLRKKIFIR